MKRKSSHFLKCRIVWLLFVFYPLLLISCNLSQKSGARKPAVKEDVSFVKPSKNEQPLSPIKTTGPHPCLNSNAASGVGLYKVQKERDGQVNIYRPVEVPAGCRMPVVSFNNGSSARCELYDDILTHLAAQGFMVACYETTNSGSAQGCMEAFDLVMARYSSVIDSESIATVGHSQGGGAAILCSYLAAQKWGASKKIVTVAIEPAHEMTARNFRAEYPQIKTPVFILSGDKDFISPYLRVKIGYDLLTTETQWFEAAGVDHFGFQSKMNSVVASFLRGKLFGDSAALQLIEQLPQNGEWKLRGKK